MFSTNYALLLILFQMVAKLSNCGKMNQCKKKNEPVLISHITAVIIIYLLERIPTTKGYILFFCLCSKQAMIQTKLKEEKQQYGYKVVKIRGYFGSLRVTGD